MTRWAALRHGLTLAGLIYIAAVWLRLVPYAEPVPEYGPMFDAYGIWNAWAGGLYDIPWLEYEAYVYSPAFAQLLYPFTLLPWPVFAALWTGLAIGILFWMRVPWMLAFPGVVDDILRGNIHVFLAGAVVLAVWRQPWGAGAWAFPFLTKVTPGIGILWHPLRGEWRALWVGLGLTAAIVGVSVVLSPELWAEWISLLAANVGSDPRIQVIPLPFLVRLPIAVVLVVLAARLDKAWLLPIGVMLALPNVWTSSTALLAGSAALLVGRAVGSATAGRARVRESGVGGRNELPVVAAGPEGQLQDAVGRIIVDRTGEQDLAEVVQRPSAGADHELDHPIGVRGARRVHRYEALVLVVVSVRTRSAPASWSRRQSASVEGRTRAPRLSSTGGDARGRGCTPSGWPRGHRAASPLGGVRRTPADLVAVRVQADDVPLPEVEAVPPLGRVAGGGAEVAEVGGRAIGLVLVVAGNRARPVRCRPQDGS